MKQLLAYIGAKVIILRVNVLCICCCCNCCMQSKAKHSKAKKWGYHGDARWDWVNRRAKKNTEKNYCRENVVGTCALHSCSLYVRACDSLASVYTIFFFLSFSLQWMQKNRTDECAKLLTELAITYLYRWVQGTMQANSVLCVCTLLDSTLLYFSRKSL